MLLPAMKSLAFAFVFALAVIIEAVNARSIRSDFASAPLPRAAVPQSPGLRLLYQNDLQWATPEAHTSRLLLESRQSYSRSLASCRSLSEQLAVIPKADLDLQKQLRYGIYKNSYSAGQQFWIGNDPNSVLEVAADGTWSLKTNPNSNALLPALCTQSASRHLANSTETSSSWHVTVGGENGAARYKGYRDALSFRFWALPYANPTQRFAYSTVYNGRASIDGTSTGRSKQCPQTAGTNEPYSEDCLFLNVFTPYLPASAATRKDLRPILVWVHGGGFTSGSGLDVTFDGGLVSSRGDVVVINVNYRLGTLGWLAYGDQIQGNYGLADVVTALKWVKANAATFGGDANKITVAGQSAGANLVEHLVGSPKAAGLFHRAIIQSGRAADRFNARQTRAEATAQKTTSVVAKLGCGNMADALTCLRQLPVEKFLNSASYALPIMDNNFVTSKQYVLNGRSNSYVNRVPIILGWMRDEQASLGYVPPSSQMDLERALTAAGVPSADIAKIRANPNVFSTNVPNGVQNLTVTIETNNKTVSRCGLAATAYSATTKASLSVWAYTQNQRSFQIPNYDPNAACQPSEGAAASDGSAYYFCHSGDLLPTFGTAGYAFGFNPRDGGDVAWVRNMIDQWTSFIRTGDPNPTSTYTKARGYDNVQGDAWPKVSFSGSARAMSLGPVQRVTALSQNAAQCEALGLGLDYIARGG